MYCLSPIAYCLLPIAYCLLPITYCLLPIAYCLLSRHLCGSPQPQAPATAPWALVLGPGPISIMLNTCASSAINRQSIGNQ